jgi:hypothetical protein
MIAHVSGTVIKGALQLDAPLTLPDHSRVTVHIEPLTATDTEPSVAFAAFRRLIADRAIQPDGRRPTREELHERR